jgi:putative sigma-54 modulation protein
LVLDESSSEVYEEKPKLTAEITPVKSDELPQLSLEDAVQEMMGNGEEYKIFSDVKTKRVNIVYKKEDGTLGLVEA